MSLKGKKVLLTGATGFIGSHLAEGLLETGARLYCVVRKPNLKSYFYKTGLSKKARLIKCDLKNKKQVLKLFKNNFDFVFHLAGILRPQNLREGFLGNILPLENLLEAAKAHKNLKAIFLASSSRVSSIEKSKIDFEALSQKPYDFSKTLGELMAKSYLREDNLPIVIVKYANVFGPGDNLVKPLRLTSAIIDDLKHHRKFIPSGNSQNPVEFLYVKDLVTEFIKSAEHYKKLIGQEVLVKPSAKYTVGEWAEKITKVIKNKKNTSKLEKSIQATYKWE